MARRIPEKDIQAIQEVLRKNPQGLSVQQISDGLTKPPPRRTLQYRIKFLVDKKLLLLEGTGRSARYRAPTLAPQPIPIRASAIPVKVTFSHAAATPKLSAPATEIRKYVRLPLEQRRPVGYKRSFLDSYRPNETHYLSAEQRAELKSTGATVADEQFAGTYARQILSRLLIDLSWNSSRLEGNTYSLLDTELLIAHAEEAEGKDLRETQMILNHKEAIEFLVDDPRGIGFNRGTILSLHALLAENLLGDPAATGRLRRMGVGIGRSVFHPLELPQLIEECFDQLLATASAISDPFEQAFFFMVQLPYLQPFDDVNKRVSRLGANIPLLKSNLSPLSFEDLSRELYTDALIGVYELNRIELLREVFIWAYKRSAARYAAVRQSLGEPDPFRMKYRTELREVITAVVGQRMNKRQAAAHIVAWAQESIDEHGRSRFRDLVERELVSLHEGNFARFRISPSRFSAWQTMWTRGRNL